jgi:hypothetical protein
MRHHRSVLALSAVIAFALVGCTAPAEPDWATAEAEAENFGEVALTQGASLGSATLRLEPQESSSSDDGVVVLSYESGERVDGVTVTCFGEGTALVGLATQIGSSWMGADSVELNCGEDGDVATLGEPTDGVNAVSISGSLTEGAGAVLAAVVEGDAATE